MFLKSEIHQGEKNIDYFNVTQYRRQIIVAKDWKFQEDKQRNSGLELVNDCNSKYPLLRDEIFIRITQSMQKFSK